ncbi:glutathione S-transferase-like [Babylonia areolata]|uniref:glutathione S-transferase-like n=1 Tax=Babylonia areolata TaxID=304850 RepID=UPI003FD035FB
MSDIKLVYFNLRARGEPIRLVLEAAGKKYEDVRLSFEQWPAEKPNSPYGQLPYVEYNGKKYGQSVALAAYFAREYGLYGRSNLDALRIDEVVCLCQDFMDVMIKARFEKDEAKKAELVKALAEEAMPKFLGFFQTLLQDNKNSDFFVGTTVSLADLFLYSVLDFLIAQKEDAAAAFPAEVKKLRSAVEAHPFLKVYLAKRPATTV